MSAPVTFSVTRVPSSVRGCFLVASLRLRLVLDALALAVEDLFSGFDPVEPQVVASRVFATFALQVVAQVVQPPGRLKPVGSPRPDDKQGYQSQYREHHPLKSNPARRGESMAGGFLSPFVTLLQDFVEFRVDFRVAHFVNRLFRHGGFRIGTMSPTPRESPFEPPRQRAPIGLAGALGYGFLDENQVPVRVGDLLAVQE